jgi:hypothetical protein
VSESKELTVTNQQLSTAGNIANLKARYDTLVLATKEVLKEGIDYGVIPGTKQRTLLKPGAEKLSTLFDMRPSFPLQDKTEDWEGGFFYYRYRCDLVTAQGEFIASAEGSCNTKEKKYRWRVQARKCPTCNNETIIKGKEEYGGGWLCFKKKGGCGFKFKDGDQSIERQTVGRIENPDVYDQVNTVQKMAQKRALVAAVLVATGASEFFTQDLEDIIEGVVTNVEPEPETAQARRPAQATPQPQGQQQPNAKKPAPLSKLYERFANLYDEAMSLGIDASTLPNDADRETVVKMGKELAAKIEKGRESREKFDATIIAQVLSAGLSENVYAFNNTVAHSALTPNDNADTVLKWFEHYRESRNADADTPEAAGIANTWLESERLNEEIPY